ncbi:hypothetical protein NCCP2716_23170 [Sporosarcina sp. NCCP-2716]|uniref:DUF771 domain-containing protein n=1 Tax=Sporosarcina sp. NCCP-2716 TaxID=2943679 RepID=UPI00203AE88E|nr:DUF771 domain-containing protein [Sporosarcina sp. NCCP-2716]GKV69819.1 hypothetical protein NCCP2716_23170 [Sporosarcina sp. NCCP-2716]
MQQLNVSLSIPIPADQVLISKIELEELRKQELSGVYWNMKDLEKRTNKGQQWLKENLLYKPRFKKELDCKSGGFVYYPEVRGETWSFHAGKMAKFLDKNFHLIFNGR